MAEAGVVVVIQWAAQYLINPYAQWMNMIDWIQSRKHTALLPFVSQGGDSKKIQWLWGKYKDCVGS